MTGETLLLQPDDDVAVALRDLPGVPRGHKVAVQSIRAGETVHKYGQVIGGGRDCEAIRQWTVWALWTGRRSRGGAVHRPGLPPGRL